MIDTAQELIDKLLKYFPRSEDVSLELTDAIKGYVRRANLNSMELERFYDVITENCSSFPVLKVAASLWKKYGERFDGGVSHDCSAINKFKNTGWRDVVNEIKAIRVIQEERELKNSEIDILNDYEDLYYIYKQLQLVPTLVMPNDSKDIYMRKVKEDIDGGIPVNLDRVRASLQRRHDEYNANYGDMEKEREVKLDKAVSDVEKAFGAKSREIELSEYEKEQCNFGFR
jgi:hypothetical protein